MRYLIHSFLIESLRFGIRIKPKDVIKGELGAGRYCYHYTRPYTLRLMDTECTLYDDIYRSEEQDCAIEDILI